MATRIRQEYSGPADEVYVKTNYPNYDFYAEIPFNSEVNISVPPDVSDDTYIEMAHDFLQDVDGPKHKAKKWATMQ